MVNKAGFSPTFNQIDPKILYPNGINTINNVNPVANLLPLTPKIILDWNQINPNTLSKTPIFDTALVKNFPPKTIVPDY